MRRSNAFLRKDHVTFIEDAEGDFDRKKKWLWSMIPQLQSWSLPHTVHNTVLRFDHVFDEYSQNGHNIIRCDITATVRSRLRDYSDPPADIKHSLSPDIQYNTVNAFIMLTSGTIYYTFVVACLIEQKKKCIIFIKNTASCRRGVKIRYQVNYTHSMHKKKLSKKKRQAQNESH